MLVQIGERYINIDAITCIEPDGIKGGLIVCLSDGLKMDFNPQEARALKLTLTSKITNAEEVAGRVDFMATR